MVAVVIRKYAWIVCLVVVCLTVSDGCSRTRYRLRADRQVTAMVNEKSDDPRWAMIDFNLGMDPRSRYFDPFNPDREPMPPDDPASHQFMHRVYGMRGYRKWHRNGNVPDIQNPGWRDRLYEYVSATEDGALKLDLDTAIDLYYMHSPDLRSQLETVYLSALDVTTERFRFNTQFYGGYGPSFISQGPLETASGSAQSTLTASTNPTPAASGILGLGGSPISTGTTPAAWQLQRHLATGGELLVQFANSFVWQFSGTNSQTTNSLLSLNLVQPLLRAGSRAVALEQLTIAERQLLANLRAWQRYRQGVFTNVAVGDLNGVVGPQRVGGFSGGTGLTGFTGQGAGGLGGVGAATNFGRAGFGAGGNQAGAAAAGTGFAGGGVANIGGFLGMLQQLQQIRNTQDSLNLQLRTLALLEANLEAGLIDITQVDIFRQNIESERGNLIQAQVGLQNSLDTFKRQVLGLPPDIEMELDDTMIRPFQFIDPKMRETEGKLADFVANIGKTEGDPPLELLNTAMEEFVTMRPAVEERVQEVEEDLAKLDEATSTRERLLNPEERTSFQADRKALAENLAQLRSRFQTSEDDFAKLKTQTGQQTRSATANALVALAGSMSTLVQELSLVQARARLEAITVEKIDLNSADALAIARANRMDWMNNRATLVNTWRLITFNANALQSNLTITLGGDLGTSSATNPLAFNAKNGDLTAGLRFDPPFTRLLERNNYRQALISYQQDRRTLIQFEDSINQTLRQDVRSLNLLRENLEIQRRAVAIAVRRVDKTLEDLNAPPPPVQPGQAAEQLGPTAAFNLLTAISDLRNAQNNFLGVWVNYYSERVQLYRDLGIMQVDDRGMFVDLPLEFVPRNCDPLPPDVPGEWLNDVNVTPDPDQAPDTLPAPNPGGKMPTLEQVDPAPNRNGAALQEPERLPKIDDLEDPPLPASSVTTRPANVRDSAASDTGSNAIAFVRTVDKKGSTAEGSSASDEKPRNSVKLAVPVRK